MRRCWIRERSPFPRHRLREHGPARRLLPAPSEHVRGGGGGHRLAAEARPHRRPAYRPREAPFAQLSGHNRLAPALRVLDRAPARLRLDDTTAPSHSSPDLTRVRLTDG